MIRERSDIDLHYDLRALFGPIAAEVSSGIEQWRRYWIVFRVEKPSGFDAAVRELSTVIARLHAERGPHSRIPFEHVAVSMRALSADTWLVEMTVPDQSLDGGHTVGALYWAVGKILLQLCGATHAQGIPIALWLPGGRDFAFDAQGVTIDSPSGRVTRWEAAAPSASDVPR